MEQGYLVYLQESGASLILNHGTQIPACLQSVIPTWMEWQCSVFAVLTQLHILATRLQAPSPIPLLFVYFKDQGLRGLKGKNYK